MLHSSREHYEKFLKLLDSYDILSREDARLYERYREKPDSFSTASVTDAAARRQTKINRFKEEKALKQKLEVCYFRRSVARYVLTASIASKTGPKRAPERRHCPTRPSPHQHHLLYIPNISVSRVDSAGIGHTSTRAHFSTEYN